MGVMSIFDEDRHRCRRRQVARRTVAIRRTAPRASSSPPGSPAKRAPSSRPRRTPMNARSSASGTIAFETAGQLGLDQLRFVLLGDVQTPTDGFGERPEHQTVAVREAAATVPPARDRRDRRCTSRTPTPAGSCRRPPGRTRAPTAAAGARRTHGTAREPSASRRRGRSAVPRARRPVARRRSPIQHASPATPAPARPCP